MKNFRTSNIDLVAYLKTINIDFTKTEISKNNHKIMFSYEYDLDKLLLIQSEFISGQITVNFTKFKSERNQILDMVKYITNKE